MSQHVRVGLEWQLGDPSCTFNFPGEPGCSEWRIAPMSDTRPMTSEQAVMLKQLAKAAYELVV
jgi:hypothetical protein